MIRKPQPLIVSLDSVQPVEGRADRRKTRTRNALLEAGQSLFATQHFDTVSVEDITEMADIAKASFYNHFSDKEALALAIGKLIHTYVAGLIDHDFALYPQPELRVVRGTFLVLRFALEYPDSAGALFRLSNDLLSFNSPLNERALQLVKDGLAVGVFSGIGEEDGSLLLIAAGSMMVQQGVEGGWEGRLRPMAERFMASVLRAFGVASEFAAAIAQAAGADILKNY
jgi:AcrR family transcriptional regulator